MLRAGCLVLLVLGCSGPSDAPDALLAPSGRRLPPAALQSTSVVVFQPFGPAVDGAEQDFARHQALLLERYYGEPSAQRLLALDADLEAVHIVDLTPSYLNAVIGLDMAVADDVLTASRIAGDWFVRQQRYKQVVVNDDASDLRPVAAASRVLSIDGWKRWWQRTRAEPSRVQRYRKRLDDLAWERARLRR